LYFFSFSFAWVCFRTTSQLTLYKLRTDPSTPSTQTLACMEPLIKNKMTPKLNRHLNRLKRLMLLPKDRLSLPKRPKLRRFQLKQSKLKKLQLPRKSKSNLLRSNSQSLRQRKLSQTPQMSTRLLLWPLLLRSSTQMSLR